eukprot:8378489-Ditylum_brightwellii.AAC.1
MLTGYVFARSANPGVTPPPGGPYKLPVQRADQIQQWEDASRAYKLCTAVNTSLHNQLTEAIEETYSPSFKN